ncbi:hypothetical protein [Solicola gregarius]|uniref:Uncharacterized protein n=1 Tax=Solicola gregarius TaxID=2908642 RepID=A0AA46TER3_9ACTN|nr:hypothetical protein [Solicola gregarius]UYM03991.1 hypothetical protein L0C25_15730 [Solicola gregarius]
MAAPAGADDYAGTVGEIVDTLEDDPILVHERMGAGDTAGAKRRLAELAAGLPFDTYVALVNVPQEVKEQTDDPSGYLIQVLHNQLRRPGLYVVQTSDGTLEVEAWGVDVDGTTLSLMSSDNSRLVNERLTDTHGDRIRALSPPVAAEIALRSADDPPPESGADSYATMSGDEVEELAQIPHAYVSTAELVGPAPDSRTGFVWMAATTIGLLVLLVGQQTLRNAWPRRRRDPKQSKPRAQAVEISIDDVRTRAGHELTELVQDLARAPADVPHPEYAQQAMLARDASEHVRDSDDLADVVGALVLARSGRRDVVRACESADSEAYRCCYFNPLHGESATQVGWQFGDAELRVPVCVACEQKQESGRTPDVLVVPDGRRKRPYYERDDVWARTGFGSVADDLGDLVLESMR